MQCVSYVPRHILLLIMAPPTRFPRCLPPLALSLTLSLFSFWIFHFVQKV